jgi:RNA polymerase sigma factor (sigma-70 family)
MEDNNLLADGFEANRPHLRAVAYRMLGSLSEADDAVQEAWIRLNRTDTASVENLGGWLTTVTARVCLDMLRSRTARREDPFAVNAPEPIAEGVDPEYEAAMADSVGLAMLVVLETLPPAERLAFVLHDMFAVPFDEIAPIVGRSSTAARQLASRARRRVQGPVAVPAVDRTRQREVVGAFLAAAREGDFDELVALLDPDATLHVDANAGGRGPAQEIHGAELIATGARAYGHRARFGRLALVDGAVGIVVAPRGKLAQAQTFVIEDDVIVAIDIVADPDRLANLEIAVLDPA